VSWALIGLILGAFSIGFFVGAAWTANAYERNEVERQAMRTAAQKKGMA
jgi:hypothetical protein